MKNSGKMNCKTCGVDSTFVYVDKKSMLCDDCRGRANEAFFRAQRDSVE